MDNRDHNDPNCITVTITVPEAQEHQQMATATVKQETIEYEEQLSQSDNMSVSGPLKPSEYVNYYDSKGYPFKIPKQEFHEDQQPQSHCSMNNKIVLDNNILLKCEDTQEIKHEEDFTLYIKEEHEDIECQSEIKGESLVKQEILSNIGDITTHCDVQETQYKMQNSLNLSKCNNEHIESDTNSPGNSKISESDENQLCERYSNDSDDMLVHINDAQSKTKPKCMLCGKQFRNVGNLDRHILLFHKQKQSTESDGMKCKHCNADFSSKYKLHKHLRLTCSGKQECGDEMGMYICNTCDTVFKDEQALITHAKRLQHDYGRKFECWCGKQFNSPINLRLHGQLHHRMQIKKDVNNGQYQCDSCQKYFKSKPSLVLHVRRVHYDYGRLFECSCGKQYRSPIYLNEHKRVHDPKVQNKDKDKFICDYCKTVFKRKPNLISHIRRFHYDYGRSFECFCGEKFCSPILFNQHKKRQHDTKIPNTDSFQCDTCQKVFKTKPCLAAHIKRMHYDYGRKFECWCGKQFRTPIQLKYHKNTQHVLMFGGYKFSL